MFSNRVFKEYSTCHKVKSYVHHGGNQQQHIQQHHQQHQRQHQHHRPQVLPGVLSRGPPQDIISTSIKPSMEEILNHIDRSSSQHQHQTSTSRLVLPSSSERTFDNFDVTPNITPEKQKPKKHVFQIFQKVPEKFSLVKDINQNIPEVENFLASSESTTETLQGTEIIPDISSDKPAGVDSAPGKLLADEPGNLRTVVIQPDKKNAKSFSSASTEAATSSSGLIR